jgi:two-component system, chemotaxis family, protein-glutamate methylesterase/glutaminase
LPQCHLHDTLALVLGSLHNDRACKNADTDARLVSPFLVSIAGSAGAFDGLNQLLQTIPSDWPTAVIVAFHTGPGSMLVEALVPRSRLPVAWATSGAVLETGRVYIAPASTHLIVNPDGRLALSSAPPIRLFRPSADWLFDSAAASFTDRHVAIVLSGMLSDGALTLREVKRHGGSVLVQDPTTCRYPDMPLAAVATGHADAVLPIDGLLPAVSHIFARRQRQYDFATWQDPFGVAPSLS